MEVGGGDSGGQLGLALSEVRRLGGVARLSELVPLGIHTATLRDLCQPRRRGGVPRLHNVSWGIYATDEGAADPMMPLVAEWLRTPMSVVCLGTAAWVHGLTTRNPGTVWLARKRGAWTGRAEQPPLGHAAEVSVVTWRDPFHGAEPVEMCGRKVPVTSPARTVVDLFRHHRRFGMNAAAEAFAAALGAGVAVGEIEAMARALGAWGEMETFAHGASAVHGRGF